MRVATAIEWSANGADVTRLVYITSTSFSGSTLLSFLLNAHPAICSVGEVTGPYRFVKDPSAYPCSCGATLTTCEFWQSVYGGMKRRGYDFRPEQWRLRFELSRNRTLNHVLTRSLRSDGLDSARDALVGIVPSWRQRLRETARRNEALVDAILEASGTSVLADASKDPSRIWHLERLTGLRPLVLHLTRDALGFASSRVKKLSPRQASPFSVADAARIWNRAGARLERFFRRLPPERCLRVRYEDLCRSPQTELGRITDRLGLLPHEMPLRFREVEHHVIGNRMRLSSSNEIRLDESWRERLTAEDVEEVRRRTAHYRAAFGYTRDDLAR